MRLFRSRPVDIASMRAWKLDPKPEAMTKIRHDDSSDPVILENFATDLDIVQTVCMSYGFR